METLSVCIIAKDEEKNIGNTLSTVTDIADEIIVLDTGSSDDTMNIAKSYGCKIYKDSFSNDFSKARNTCMSYATMDWILIIDCDEILCSCDKITEVLTMKYNSTVAYNLIIESHENGIVTQKSPCIRLFRNYLGFYYIYSLHEQILPSILNQYDYSYIENIDTFIIHRGYHGEDMYKNSKIKRNLDILYNIPLTEYTFYEHYLLGNIYSSIGDYDKAFIYYESSLKYGIEKSIYYLSFIENYISNLLDLNKYSTALKLINMLINSYEDFRDLYFYRAICYNSIGFLFEAHESLIKYNSLNYSVKYPDFAFHSKFNTIEIMNNIGGFINFKKSNENITLVVYAYTKDIISVINTIKNVAFICSSIEVRTDESSYSDLITLENYPLVEVISESSIYENSYFPILKSNDLKFSLLINHETIIDYESVLRIEDSLKYSCEKPTLSVCIICKDEEKNLEYTLESIKNISDEIIFVDTGSKDGSIDIAEKYTNNIYSIEWENDFSKARNFALSKATSEWILIIDCDEILENICKKTLEDLLSNLLIDAYLLQISIIEQENENLYPVCRLFRNRCHFKFKNKLHEQVIQCFSPSRIANCPIKIHHMGYSENILLEKEKIDRNHKILMSYEESEKDAFYYYCLGNSYFTMGNYEVAANHYEISIDMNYDPYGFSESLINNLAECYEILKRYDSLYKLQKLYVSRYLNKNI